MSGGLLKNESGYSLVEVMVAIMILSIAIIPMVGMFDIGLKSATLGGNYDKARFLANENLEEVKAVSYSAAVAKYPPSASPAYTGTEGIFTYTIDTTYLDHNLSPDPDAKSRMQVDVTVEWEGSKTYSNTGLVTQGSP